MSAQANVILDPVPSLSGCPPADTLVSGSETSDVDAIVERALRAHNAIQTWSEARIDRLLQALAERLSDHAEELARAAVQETGLGNVADKTLKNRFASLGIYHSLRGQLGQGRLQMDKQRKVVTLASPVGVVFGLVPVTNPTSTFIFKVLICLKGRNAVILSPSRRALGVCTRLGRLVQDVLRAHDAPVDLVQWVGANPSQAMALAFMQHPGVSFILATGGPAMVKAAYHSGKPAIGVGPGNAPALICADADLSHAASSIVSSKSFDHGIVCCSEQHLVVVKNCVQPFMEALQRQGAAVLSGGETASFLDSMVDPVSHRLKSEFQGQSAAELAAGIGIRRTYAITLLVIPTEAVCASNPLAVEKLAPILSLFTVADEQAGMQMCEDLLALDGSGHTAIIHTRTNALVETFSLRMPASRILVNTPGTQGGIGMTTGLIPSMTLGCGTFGGTSTTDNVTYTHLLNLKRVAYDRLHTTLPVGCSRHPWLPGDHLWHKGLEFASTPFQHSRAWLCRLLHQHSW